ncbi:DUF1643 domain-containing protein [Streptomyces sp. NBC_01197]|uniref:DUF1643 domain-containing protein n=1 Tax=Streptomyces sp. NBC_01197 TaxID=2903768 RepID=UPI002E13A964|nr:DUF1643 domain-containing protein [Streptomyces sp. NBC_01197]
MTLPEQIQAWAADQGLTHQQGDAGTAVFSPDLVHRYALTRTWVPGPHWVYVLLNPSMATADQDDPTVRRLVGFAQRDRCGGLVLANLFAVRSTDPSVLTTGLLDTVGAHNDALLQLLAETAHDLTLGWGAWGRLQRAAIVEKAHGARLWALGTTKAGHPRHPLYLPAVAPLHPYEPGGVAR